MKGDSVANERVTLDELKKKMADLAKERDWDQFHSPRNLLLALVCPMFLAFFFCSHFLSYLEVAFYSFPFVAQKESTLSDSNIHLPTIFRSAENIVMVALFVRLGPYSVLFYLSFSSWILPTVLPCRIN